MSPYHIIWDEIYSKEEEFIVHVSAGAQLGIFMGRGPVQEKGTLELFKEDMAIQHCSADS